jgi:hypothetical protein
MGVACSLIVFAAGAVMRFAVTTTSPDFNVRTVGVILMIVGAVGFVISLIFWSSWGGFGSYRRERRVVSSGSSYDGLAPPPSGARPGAYEEHEVRSS